jgi:RNA polymerase sigma-70 factor (ECF subfamily)
MNAVFPATWLTVRLVPEAPAREDADEPLVARARGGDRRAYDELYRRNVDVVWHRLTRLLGPDPEREDLTQQVFLEAFRGLEGFRGQARFRTFLCRVAVNKAIDHLERQRRRPRPLAPEDFDLVIETGASPEQRADQRQQLALVFSLLDRIKPKKRVAFALRVIEGLSLEEVAELVQATVPAVAQRVRHAHDELQAMLARRGSLP